MGREGEGRRERGWEAACSPLLGLLSSPRSPRLLYCPSPVCVSVRTRVRTSVLRVLSIPSRPRPIRQAPHSLGYEHTVLSSGISILS